MKTFLFFILISIPGLLLKAQVPQTIKLNKPDEKGGIPLMQALSERKSASEFKEKEPELQIISDLLWASNGINRPEEGKRTAPSAVNAQEVDIFVVFKTGIYLYNAKENQLELKTEGDHRSIIAGKQANFSSAPLFLLLVSDISKFKMGSPEEKEKWGALDAGIVCQNALLYCASAGLNARPRVTMETDKIKEVLKLTDFQIAFLNIPVSCK